MAVDRTGSMRNGPQQRLPHDRLWPAPLAAALLVGATRASGCLMSVFADAELYRPSMGSNVRTEEVDALGFAIVVDDDGNGRVVGTLINTEYRPHAVTGAAVKSAREPVVAALLADVVRLPPHEQVDLTKQPPVSVPAADLSVGSFVELTLDVTDGELVQMLVPVEAQKGPYADVEVAPVPDGITAAP